MEKPTTEVKTGGFVANEWGFVFFIGLMVVCVVGGLAYLVLRSIGR
jgi:hypothetical protein